MKLKSLRDLFCRISPDGKTRHELRQFNLGMTGESTPPSALELAKRLGFDVILIDMPKRQRGKLVRDTFADNGFRIEVNKAENGGEKVVHGSGGMSPLRAAQ